VKAVAAVVAGVAIVAAPVARAWACGGGDGDGGSSSSGGDSGGGGGDSSSSSSDSATVTCTETSEILGRRQCGEFGEWAMPRVLPAITIEIGSSVRSFGLGGLRLAGTIDHAEHGSYQYSMVSGGGEGAPMAVAGGVDLRMLFGKRLYVGAEASLGGIHEDDRATEMVTAEEMPGANLRANVQLHVTGGAVVGARLPLGDFQLAAELLAGTRMVQVAFESQYLSCETTEYERDVTAVLEPRLRLDYWLSPWAAVGAFAGRDLLSKDSQVFGVYLGGHSRAFDALR
jgi:hypothetical protein